MKKIEKIAFIGLGVMGAPMARHLHRAGFFVNVYNRTELKAISWVGGLPNHGEGGAFSRTPALAAKDADLICLCVGNDDDIRGVILGPDGVLSGAKKGAIICDHTTASATLAREMEVVCGHAGVAFLDAPVSGGQAGAEKGALSVMVGGDAQAFAAIEPVLRAAYAKEMRLMGPSGCGQLTKMVNQILIAGVVQGLAEGLAFGQRAGLDMDQVIEVIGKGAAQSWQLDNRAKTMVHDEFDFGFAVDWMIKDLGIAMNEAARNGARLDSTKEILEYYRELSGRGDGRKDTSALIKRLR